MFVRLLSIGLIVVMFFDVVVNFSLVFNGFFGLIVLGVILSLIFLEIEVIFKRLFRVNYFFILLLIVLMIVLWLLMRYGLFCFDFFGRLVFFIGVFKLLEMV